MIDEMLKKDRYFEVAESLAQLLDNQFKIGTFRIGIEPLIGLIPGIGDALTLFLSLYLVWVGIKMKLPVEKITLMIVNVALDFILGIIPVVGDVSDFFYKANLKNMEILRSFRSKTPIVDAEIV